MTADGLRRRRTDFGRLWAADAFSQIGSQVSVLALPLAAVTLHASTFEVAVLPALQTAAFLVLGLPAGVWSDRVRRRPLIISADLGRLVLLGSVPVAAMLGSLTIWWMYVVAFAVGVCTVFFDVAFQSYVPTVVDRRSLVEANSRLEINRSVAAAAGPVTAGFLVQWLTAPIAIAVDAVSFAWSAAWMATIAQKEPRPEAPARGAKLWRQVAEGIRFVFGHPTLRAIASYNGTAMMAYSALGALEVVFLLRELRVTPAIVGLLFAGGSVGSLLGALLAARLTRAIGRHRALPAFAVLAGLGSLLLPLTGDGWKLALFSVGAAVSGFCLVAYNVVQVSFRQAVCPEHLLGRMNATMRTITLGGSTVGAILGGLLGTWFGVWVALWIIAAGALAASLWLVGLSRVAAPDEAAEQPAGSRGPGPSKPGAREETRAPSAASRSDG